MHRGKQIYQTLWLDNVDASNYLLDDLVPGEGVPIPECGVSLNFLQLLLAHTRMHFPKEKTTAAFVSEAIIPLTSSRSKCYAL
jgi:hypothetical protein